MPVALYGFRQNMPVVIFAMKLQWLWRMQCHITSSLILQADAWTALALHALD
jgi:hypothetical protein